MQKWTHVVELSHVGTQKREKNWKEDTKTRLSSLTRKDFFFPNSF